MLIGNRCKFFVSKLTKNDWEAFAACHNTTFPSPSATPNLLPCWVNLNRLTLAKTPAGLTFCTAWPCDHSHILIDPSWLPDTSGENSNCIDLVKLISSKVS